MDKWIGPTIDVCPHGLRVRLVDGTYVRNHYDSDFSQGGNGFAYKWVPKNEIWIDAQISEVEWPLIIFHECTEAELMRGGMSYDKAHDKVKRWEDQIRRAPRPTDDRNRQPLDRREALEMISLLRPAAEYLHYNNQTRGSQTLENSLRMIIVRLALVP